VHQLYYGNQGWSDQDLTGETAGPLAAAGIGIAAFADAHGEHICYLAADRHVHQLYYGNQGWSDQDLTGETDGPLAAGTSTNRQGR
jgi:hypothetical protein